MTPRWACCAAPVSNAFGLISTVLQHEAGNDFGFADRRMGLLEDSFAEREKAQAETAPPAVVIGPVDRAGQRDLSQRLLG